MYDIKDKAPPEKKEKLQAYLDQTDETMEDIFTYWYDFKETDEQLLEDAKAQREFMQSYMKKNLEEVNWTFDQDSVDTISPKSAQLEHVSSSLTISMQSLSFMSLQSTTCKYSNPLKILKSTLRLPRLPFWNS